MCAFSTFDWMHFECINCGRKITATEQQTSMPVFPCNKDLLKNNRDNNTYIEDMINLHKDKGINLASKETIASRLSICDSCEFFKNDTCEQCGCAMMRNKNYVGKILKQDAQCPINKW